MTVDMNDTMRFTPEKVNGALTVTMIQADK